MLSLAAGVGRLEAEFACSARRFTGDRAAAFQAVRVRHATRLVLFGILLGLLAPACTGPKPFLLQGGPGSAQVGYSGMIDDATAVARQHCAQYERVPRFVEADQNVAFFDCVPR